MAELSTIARPYAQALFASEETNPTAARGWLTELAAITENPQLRLFADNPHIVVQTVFDVIVGVAKSNLDDKARNFLRTLIDAHRLVLLPEILAQYVALVDAQSGVRRAEVFSAFEMNAQTLDQLQKALEKRFGGKLQLHAQVDASLIGGIRVVVGDEVLDTSVKARLEQMKATLTA